MGFEVLRALNINTVFRNMTPCRLVVDSRFSEKPAASIQADSFSRTTEGAVFSEASVPIYPAARLFTFRKILIIIMVVADDNKYFKPHIGIRV
jgi:hypothetical protein